jgi:small subunit ribosomal protein S4
MRKIRKKTKRPRIPWDQVQIEAEKKLLNDYGLRRKREIRSSESMLRNFRRRARDLIAVKNPEEEKTLLEKLNKLGIITKEKATVDDVLGLDVRNVLDRRLQTLVFRKGLAPSIRQARQSIVHGHVMVGERRVQFPSYIVPAEREKHIKLVEKGGRK